MKKYILFDNDGVLVETEKWYYEASRKALAEIGSTLELDTYLKIMARGGTAWEVAEKEGVPENVIVEQRRKRNIYYQEFLEQEDIEIQGVTDVLEELSKTYKMGIVTTSRRVDFELIHNKRGIVKYMDFVLCEEDYPRAKPYPDPYLAGQKLFGATKEECIIVEDSQRGLSSAINAGIECVIVDNAFTRSHDFTGASYRIMELRELVGVLKRIG